MARLNPTTPGAQAIQQPDRREFMPVADTLVTAPQPQQQSDWEQLAQGLAKVAPELNQFLQQQHVEQSKEEMAAGRAAQIKTGLAMGEAVRRGVLPPDQSPMFTAGYNEMDGKNAAYSIGETVTGQLKSDPVINSSDPAAVHQWVGKQIQGGIAKLDPSQTSDPSFMQAFTKNVEPYYSRAAAMHAQQSSANATDAMNNALGTQFSQIIDAAYSNAKPGESPDPATLAATLHQATTIPSFVGVKPQEAQNLMAQALQNAALAHKDPDVMQALMQGRPNRVNPQGPSDTLPGFGTTVQGQSFIQATQDHINASIARDNAQQHAQDEQARQATERSWLQKGTAEFLSTGTVSPQTMASANAAGAGETIPKFLALTENGRKVNDYVPPEQFAAALTDLQMGRFGNTKDGSLIVDPVHAALQMVQDHRIPGQDTEKFMNAAISQQDSGLYKNADYKRIIGQISGEIPDPIMGKMFLTPGLQAQATNEFAANAQQRVKDLQAQGKANDPGAVLSALSDEQQKIVTKYQKMNGLAKADGADASMAAPKLATDQTQQMSTSGTPKLETASPSDIKKLKDLISTPGADSATIKSDVKNKYSDAAIARFFPFLK